MLLLSQQGDVPQLGPNAKRMRTSSCVIACTWQIYHMDITKKERWTEEEVAALPTGEHDYFDRKSGGLLTDANFRKDLVPRPAKNDKLRLQPTYHGFKRTRRLSREF